jgi:hypothetical protein
MVGVGVKVGGDTQAQSHPHGAQAIHSPGAQVGGAHAPGVQVGVAEVVRDGVLVVAPADAATSHTSANTCARIAMAREPRVTDATTPTGLRSCIDPCATRATGSTLVI